MPSSLNLTQESSRTLFGYVVGPETQFVLFANPPSAKGMLIPVALSIGVLIVNGYQAFQEALCMGLFLGSVVALAISFPQLVLIGVEEQAIVLVRASAFGKRLARRIPISEVQRIEQGDVYFGSFRLASCGDFDLDAGGRPRACCSAVMLTNFAVLNTEDHVATVHAKWAARTARRSATAEPAFRTG